MSLFDSHFHIIDPRFPLVPNHGFLPEPFTVADYKTRVEPLGIGGGAVVSGSFQAFDQSYLLEALSILGKTFVGVTQLPASASDEEILALSDAGVRGIRFNVRRGGSEELSRIKELAARVYDLASWHVELHIDAKEIDDFLAEVLFSLPKVSIDHVGLSKEGLPVVLRLAEKGVRIKATGFGRLDFEVQPVLSKIAGVNPDSLLFGTDLPCTRAPVPFSASDLNLIRETFEGDMLAKVLSKNARKFYGISV
ncbi:2-pyrone-4,6-dicarboxylate hydrolase [Leptospira fluminis]|uniref:2-pyrone-4,6-dicarboxylate hydrolase n=1 Tax=Leptospira fluminis TaxID=2484979 RepID=A0A4R9GT62_9LEPT|nr:amidohydrolase family protein [Leptospira fluminis]TGK20780.1 2-pyrone-4,6-dicarboxylate hydrolase [Leptospira fluminis]